VSETDKKALTFASLGLHDSLVAAVTALGYEEATPIQAEAIPLLLTGKDLIGQAGTGTGKTAAFALPLLHRLLSEPIPARGPARALILVPTRELAMQVAEAIHKYAKGTSLTVVPVYGGAPMDQQIRALRRGADVVVATPGRALDHLKRQTLVLDALEVLVLDEADEMLDMGFAEDLDLLLSATPKTRQTALFAATMAARISAIAEKHLKSPKRVNIKAEKSAPGKMPRVRQVAYLVSRQQKSFALDRILEFEDPASAIIFCRTRVEVDELTDTLKSHGYAAQALHGGMEQRQRDRVMQLIRDDKADVLVATDVAARGLDIDHISHVINYDIPTSPEVYVHRIGRTGRIGREGVAITLVDPREQRTLRFIETVTKQTLERAELPTLAALKAKRLDVTRAALQARIVGGGLEETKAFVLSLAADFDLADIAAAAVAIAQEEEKAAEPRTADVPRSRGSEGPQSRGSDAPRSRNAEGPRARRDDGPKTTLAFSVGEEDGVGPGDLVGAIAGESGIDSANIGAIRVNPTFSTVDVSEALADTVMDALKGKKIRGTPVDIKVMPAGEGGGDRPRPRTGGKPGGFKPREYAPRGEFKPRADFKPRGEFKPRSEFKPRGEFKPAGKAGGFKPAFKAKAKPGFSSDFKPRKRER
jgi:ATP-dependent RNA helicase DeaD